MQTSALLAIVAIGVTTLTITIPMSYAAPVPSFVPAQCQTYVDQPSQDHELKVLTPGPYVPGQTIDVSAGTTDTGTGANRVRIVAIVGGSTVIHNNVMLLPNPHGDVSDTIQIPADTPLHSSLDIYACFESPGSLQGIGVTHHLDVGSFFVIPESAIGGIALAGSSLAALGGFVYFKQFRKGIA